MAHVISAYERGRNAGRQRLATSLNPYAEHTWNFTEWQRGWILETGAQLHGRARPADSALVLPHPVLTGAQLELLCAREGLTLAHRGNARFALVQTSARRPQTMLRVHVNVKSSPIDPREITKAIRAALEPNKPEAA